jgi:sensor histidine kinase YesM
LVRLALRGRLPAIGLLVAIPAGNLIGSLLARQIGAPDPISMVLHDPASMRRVILSNVLIGLVVTAFFLYFSHSQNVKADLERERRRVAEALQSETAARLALLQAQIEPHFLFNTLANIHSLIQEDPDTAGLIMEQLNVYLRTSLRRTRHMTTTVGEELELVEALLAIAAMRLGSRLEYSLSAPADLRALILPPLLLQPLVENAIKHGIEPSISGGTIRVEVRRERDVLELTVDDTGAGLNADSPEGVGLANVRARLANLYGEQGRLSLYAKTPRGVTAKLALPLSST